MPHVTHGTGATLQAGAGSGAEMVTAASERGQITSAVLHPTLNWGAALLAGAGSGVQMVRATFERV